jgi:trafficking protein particle complex subunit 11
MDGYPPATLDHNVPFLVLSGLVSTNTNELPVFPELMDEAILLRSELPAVEGNDADALKQYFLNIDARDAPWNGRDTGHAYRFRVGTTGRVWVSAQPIAEVALTSC